MKKLLTTVTTVYKMVSTTKEEFKRRAAENRKILIRGSVLDPDNHLSYNK